jgi:hypothetical protein
MGVDGSSSSCSKVDNFLYDSQTRHKPNTKLTGRLNGLTRLIK